MNAPFRWSLAVLFLITLALVAEAKDWRDLTPLHSTRADMIALLGTERPRLSYGPLSSVIPSERDPKRISYELGNGVVSFSFAAPVVERTAGPPAAVTEDTILTIWFTPDCPATWAELQLERSRFRRSGPPRTNPRDSELFIDTRNGVIVNVYANRILEALYFPPSNEIDALGDYLGEPGKLLQTYDPAESLKDTYSCVQTSNGFAMTAYSEKGILDLLAAELQADPNRHGYVIAYGTCRQRFRDGRKLAKLSRDYLVQTRGIDPARFTIVEGGYRSESYLSAMYVPEGRERPYRTRRFNETVSSALIKASGRFVGQISTKRR